MLSTLGGSGLCCLPLARPPGVSKEGLTPCPTGPVSVLGAENESGCRVGEAGGWLVKVLCDRLVPYSHAVKVQADTRFFHSNWDEIH